MTSEKLRFACMLHCQLCIDAVKQWSETHHEFFLVYAGDSQGITTTQLTDPSLDVVLIDLDLKEDAFDLAGNIRSSGNKAKIAFVGGEWTDLLMAKALQADAKGLLLKNESPQALFEHLQQICLGETRFSEGLKSRVQYDSVTHAYSIATRDPVASLSALQLEIFRLLAYGDSLKMIASKLKLSRKSIDGHKYRLMRKLGINDRVLLSRLAIREGLIQP